MRITDERDLRNRMAEVVASRTRMVTLAANAAATTVSDGRIRHDSPILFVPTTASAAAELAGGALYVGEAGRTNGSVVITHANSALTDRTFRLLIG